MPQILSSNIKTKTIKKTLESKKSLISLKNKFSSTNLFKKTKETCDIFQILQPMHKVLQLFAPMPYNISEVNGVFKATVKHNKFLYYLIYFIIYIATTAVGILDHTSNSLEYAEIQINVAATNLLFVAVCIYKMKIVKMLNKIAKLERKLKKLGFKIEYKFYIGLLWIVLTTDAVLLLTIRKVTVLMGPADTADYLTNVLYIFIGLSKSFYFYYIILCILLINNMLQNLNIFLITTSESDSERSRIVNIKIARKIYSDIWHVLKCFNLNFNIPMTIICGICFMNSTTTIYDFWQQRGYYTGSETIQWIIINAGKIVILSSVCDVSKQEGEKLKELLHKMYAKTSLDGNERFIIYQFLMQTMHEKTDYWGCDMFPINKSFICSVVVVGTTNSILLLQLGVNKGLPQYATQLQTLHNL